MLLVRVLVPSVLFLLSPCFGQDCTELQTSDLGSTTAPSTAGLLARTLATQSGDATPSIQVLDSNVVCLAQAPVRDSYRFVSVVVRYLRSSDNMMVTAQFEYECIGGVWDFRSPAITSSPSATLSTAVKTDCFSCTDPASAPTALVVTPVEHCVGMFKYSLESSPFARSTGCIASPAREKGSSQTRIALLSHVVQEFL